MRSGVVFEYLTFQSIHAIIPISSPQRAFKKLEFQTMKNFVNGLGTEFKKVVWPKPAEAFGHAVLVIAIALLVAYYLGLLDAIFAAILKMIIG